MNTPVTIEFPLRGEWQAPNTPGTKIPSHGTHQYGSTYAYDFIQVNWEKWGHPAYRSNVLKYLLFGLPLSNYYGWGQAIYAPLDGIVVMVEDGCVERARTHFFKDMANANKNANHFDIEKENIQNVAGNYVIMEIGKQVYAVFCHLQQGTITITKNQFVHKGEIIAHIGHSGNSFLPHLHFQLMDSSNIATAKGLPCAFEELEIYSHGQWKKVVNVIPTSKDRIRFNKNGKEYLV